MTKKTSFAFPLIPNFREFNTKLRLSTQFCGFMFRNDQVTISSVVRLIQNKEFKLNSASVLFVKIFIIHKFAETFAICDLSVPHTRKELGKIIFQIIFNGFLISERFQVS